MKTFLSSELLLYTEDATLAVSVTRRRVGEDGEVVAHGPMTSGFQNSVSKYSRTVEFES